MNYKLIGKSVVQIVLFGAVCIALVVAVNTLNKEQIAENKRAFLLKQLGELVQGYDNDILAESYEKSISLYGGKTQFITIYPAKRNNQLIARLIKHTYPNGYSGNITLLSAVDTHNQIIGVRVLEHKETPGLGDKIELAKSNWILSFNGKSLANTPVNAWNVKKKGGEFDSFSGATITPQAVVSAVYGLLLALKK